MLLSSCCFAHAQQLSSGEIVDNGVPEWTYIYEHIDKFACPEYYTRRDILRFYQRRGYADILSQLSHQDILSAIIDYVRMQLQIEYSLNHEPIYCTYQDGSYLVLSLDWVYPVDPWKRDSTAQR